MTVALDVVDVAKSFGPVRALRGVSLSLRSGEVHGLLGENGAGKSTLIKILTGFHQPDQGELRVDGRAVRLADPRAAREAGVVAVYQEINLIPDRSVADNLFLGREPVRAGLWIDRRRMRREASSLLGRYGLPIDAAAPLGSLGLGLQQMVSIARAISLGARVVILDEPTSALSNTEAEVLFGVVERLRDEGIALLFVSHRLSECYRLCDWLTVLRDGQVVRSAPTAELPRAALVEAMLGRARDDVATAGAAWVPRDESAPALEVRGLRWRHRVRDVSFAVRPGEIVGLVGLLGSGRTETLQAIFGAEQAEAGTVRLAGETLRGGGPAASIRRGLAFLPEDRRSEGIFPRLSVRDNMTASLLPRLARFGLLRRRRQDALVARFIRELGVRSAGPQQPIGELSGGNQQKVLLARCLATSPRAVMLDDPTRGIDVGAKQEVHRAIRALASQGLGVLATSSELDELLELADRLVVLVEGEVVGELPAAGARAEDVLAMLSATHEPAEAVH